MGVRSTAFCSPGPNRIEEPAGIASLMPYAAARSNRSLGLASKKWKCEVTLMGTVEVLVTNTVTWSREWGPFGIRCGAVAPGMIETPMTQGMNQKARDALVANVPVGRVGLPEDIWLAVKFVCECDYFNGRTIDVDGGLSM